MATHCSILAWEIPWTEKPGGLQLMGYQRVRHDLGTTTAKHFKKKKCWSIQSENSRMERRKRKRQEIKLENRLEQRKQHRGNDQREDVEKSPGINNCHENSE